MTQEQAVREFARLCAALGRDPKELRAGQTAAWLETLRALPYERGRLAITAVIETWDRASFPPPGSLSKRAQEVGFEGHPNAAAYSQNGSHTPWHHTEEAAYAIWRQTQIEQIDEDRYWDYVHDPILRDAQDREWRQQWESQMRGPDAGWREREEAVERG